jgi:hypothetical protein
MLHFEQCQLFAILKALQDFWIHWFEVLYAQHNIGALEFVVYPLHRFTRWFFATICCSHSMGLDCYCRFLRFRVHTLATKLKLKLYYVCSKGNRSHKNQKSCCSTCNSHDRIGSGEMEVCKALHFASPYLEAACHYHMQHSSQDERVQRDVKSCDST